ncbi:hypothetical protein Bca101_043798 [Brassica carinata]
MVYQRAKGMQTVPSKQKAEALKTQLHKQPTKASRDDFGRLITAKMFAFLSKLLPKDSISAIQPQESNQTLSTTLDKPSMSPKGPIPLNYSCDEIYERMENGLCIFCEERDTLGHHDLKHKGVSILMTEIENEPIVQEILVESDESVLETAVKPDSSSKSLESFISDLLTVDDAGQKEDRNKSDVEEKTSLSIGKRWFTNKTRYMGRDREVSQSLSDTDYKLETSGDSSTRNFDVVRSTRKSNIKPRGAKIVKRSPKNAYGFDRKVSETMNFNGACPVWLNSGFNSENKFPVPPDRNKNQPVLTSHKEKRFVIFEKEFMPLILNHTYLDEAPGAVAVARCLKHTRTKIHCTKTSDILLAIERVNTMSFYNDSSWVTVSNKRDCSRGSKKSYKRLPLRFLYIDKAAQGHNTLLRRDVNGYLLLASRGLCDGLPEASFGNFVITKIVAIGIPEMAFRGNLKSFDERSFSGKWLLHMFLKNNYKIEYMVKGDSFDNMPLLREDFPLFKSVISLREELEQYVDAINMIICGKFTTPHSFNLCS